MQNPWYNLRRLRDKMVPWPPLPKIVLNFFIFSSALSVHGSPNKETAQRWSVGGEERRNGSLRPNKRRIGKIYMEMSVSYVIYTYINMHISSLSAPPPASPKLGRNTIAISHFEDAEKNLHSRLERFCPFN